MGPATKKNRIKQFEGENFEQWKYRVEIFLDMEGLKEMLTSNVVPEAAADKIDWEKNNKKTKAYLVSFIADTYLEYVRDKNTAEEMWSCLVASFSKRGAASQNYLRRCLLNMKYEEGTQMREHFQRFDECVRELKSSGATLSDADLVSHMFLTLPSSFDALTRALENMSPAELTLDVLKSRLLSDEQKRSCRDKFDNNVSEAAAFASQQIKKKRKYNVRCFKCGKRGHLKMDCRSEKQSSEAQIATSSKENYSVCFMASFGKTGRINNESVWILDSGSSDHLINEEFFNNSYILNSPLKINVAKEDQSMNATKVGSVKAISKVESEKIAIDIKQVYYVPDLRNNLLSVKSLTRSGIEVLFSYNVATLKKNGQIVGVAKLKNDLYELQLEIVRPSANSCLKIDKMKDTWHRRLGHLNQQYVYKLQQHKMVDGMGIVQREIDFCEFCVQGKQCHLPFSGTRSSTKRPLERIHCDVCGPINPISYDGKKYFVTFMDDYTHFTVVFLIQAKSDVFKYFKEYEEMASAKFGAKIHIFRSDLGKEFFSNEQMAYYKSKGIQLESNVAYTPELNGVAERFNRTVVEKARTMLLESKLSKEMWSEAILTATYLINRSPTAALKENTTPAEKWYGVKPNLNKLRIFGCQAFVLIPKPKRKSKMDAKSKVCLMLGYSPNGYRLWDQELSKVIIARDVIFNELQLPGSAAKTVDNENLTDFDTCSNIISIFQQEGDIEVRNAQDIDIQNDENLTASDDEFFDPGSEGEVSSALPSQSERPAEDVQVPRRSDRERRLPGKYHDYDMSCSAFSACYNFTEAPEDYKSIKSHPECEKWELAVQDEIKSLINNKTWEVCDHPKNIQPLRSKWVLKIKNDKHGNVQKYKARLVAKGFMQKQGRDFQETFAPVAKLATIRIVLAVANKKKYMCHQMDVKTAFLNGFLDEDVYMYPPEGFEVDSGKLCKLKKSLYGLKQSPRCWNIRFNNFILKLNFIRSNHDYCVYVRVSGKEVTYVILYVDDLLIIGNNSKTIETIKNLLANEFEMSDLGRLDYFLGMSIEQSTETGKIFISQEQAISSL